jgi:hypothetical protein
VALFNEILEGRYGLILSKLLSMKGSDTGAPQLSGDLVSTFVLEADAPEWYALGGGRLCFGQGQLAAGGAGNRSVVALSNPASSGIIARLEYITFASTAAFFGAPIRSNPNVTGMGTSSTVGVRDARIQQTPSCAIRTTNGFAVGGTLRTVVFPDFSAAAIYAGRIDVSNMGIVLSPNTAIQVDCGNDNQDFQCSFWWKERAANDGELRLGA